jgi:hypothetical protein
MQFDGGFRLDDGHKKIGDNGSWLKGMTLARDGALMSNGCSSLARSAEVRVSHIS